MYVIIYEGCGSMKSSPGSAEETFDDKSIQFVEPDQIEEQDEPSLLKKVPCSPDQIDVSPDDTPPPSPQPEGNDSNVRDAVKCVVRENSREPVFSRIPGIQWIEDGNRGVGMQLLFIFILALGLIASGYIVCQRYWYYLKKPTKIYVFHDPVGAYTRFPKVMACLEPTAASSEALRGAERGFRKLDLLQIMSAEQLWQTWNTSADVLSAELWEGSKKTAVNVSTAPTSHGYCTVFEIGKMVPSNSVLNISFKSSSYRNERGLTEESTTIFLSDASSVLSQETKVYIQNGVKTNVAIQQYKREKLAAKFFQCTSATKFELCQRRCLLKQMRNLELPCRMLYMTSNASVCKVPAEAAKAISQYDHIEDSVKRNRYCSCMQPCSSFTYSATKEVEEAKKQSSKTTILLRMTEEVIETERFIYDTCNLIWECAEVFEIINGVSLLLLFYAIPALAKTCCKKESNTNFPSTVHDVITRLFCAEIQLPTNSIDAKTLWSFFPTVLWFTFVSICVVNTASLMAYRICSYLSNPDYITHTWHHNSNRTLPNIILCGEGNQVGNLRRVIKTQHNFQEVCNISMWDILDYSSIGMEKLWQYTNIRDILSDSQKMNAQLIASPYGQCLKLPREEFSEEIIVGLMPQTFTPCPDSGLKIFISVDEVIDNKVWLTPNVEIAMPSKTEIQFQDTIKFQQEMCHPRRDSLCENVCWENMLNDNITCRLPYMTNVSSDTEVCNSSKSAKASHKLYIELLAEFNPFSPLCGCPRPCAKQALQFEEQSQYLTEAWSLTTIRFSFASSLTEHVTHSKRKALFKLIKDCLRLVKFFLGLSVVGFIYAIVTAFNCVYNTVCGKKKTVNQIVPAHKKFPEPETTILPLK